MAATEDDPDAVYIKAKLGEAEEAQRRSLRDYRDAGQRLAAKQARLAHGEWLPWLEANGIDQRRASECMRLRMGWSKLPTPVLSLREALRFLRGAGKKADKQNRPALVIDRDRPPPHRIDLSGEPLEVPDETVMTEAHYDPERVIGAGELAERDVDVYRPDGSLLLAYRWRAVGVEPCEVAHPALRSAVRWSEHRQAESSVIGFYDHPEEDKRTAFNKDQPAKFAQIVPYVRALDDVFRRTAPGEYAHQLAAFANTDPRWVIFDTVFTTVTVNRTEPFPAHRDSNNLPDSLAVLAVFRAGEFSGGLLVFPRWRLALNLSTRDVLIADVVTEPHGVTAFVPAGDDPFERISVVAYFRDGLANLPR